MTFMFFKHYKTSQDTKTVSKLLKTFWNSLRFFEGFSKSIQDTWVLVLVSNRKEKVLRQVLGLAESRNVSVHQNSYKQTRIVMKKVDSFPLNWFSFVNFQSIRTGFCRKKINSGFFAINCMSSAKRHFTDYAKQHGNRKVSLIYSERASEDLELLNKFVVLKCIK